MTLFVLPSLFEQLLGLLVPGVLFDSSHGLFVRRCILPSFGERFEDDFDARSKLFLCCSAVLDGSQLGLSSLRLSLTSWSVSRGCSATEKMNF